MLLLVASCASEDFDRGTQAAQTAATTAKGGVVPAAQAPLKDVNLIQTEIPPALLAAREAPYARPKPYTCAQIAKEIAPLDEALGADLDQPPSTGDPDMLEHDAKAAGGFAADAMKDAAQSLIPMRGWVRKLSGAEQHAKLVQESVNAGAVRRGYLKGLGLAKKCKPPSAPQVEAENATPTVR